MDEYKAKFDKIIGQISEDLGNSVPKRLSYDNGNDSFSMSAPKKRKFSMDKNESLNKDLNNTREMNCSSESLNSSIMSSPWEMRRIKADLLEAKSRIAQLRHEIDQQNSVRSKMEMMYNNKVSALQKQCEYTSEKCLDMEKHISSMRKQKQATSAELEKVRNLLNNQKQSYEDTIYTLRRTNADLEQEVLSLRNQLANEESEFRREIDRLESNLEITTQELAACKTERDEVKYKASQYDKLELELETERHALALAKSNIKDLEYEIASYGEWKELSKTSQSRLTNMPDIEREINRLRQETKNLRDSLGNKLLLEEQVSDLTARLEKYEEINKEATTLKVQVNTLEAELKDWKQLVSDHCPVHSPLNPRSLRHRIEEILQKDLILTSEKGNNKNEKDTFKIKLQDLENQNEIYMKSNEDLKKVLKHHKTILLRVQKKLMLVAKERDCYKQLVENFEKDLTISGALADSLYPDSQMRARLDMLERSLNCYKEMCANLEKELESVKLLPDLPLEMPMNTESYDRFKKEIDSLRLENDRLKRRKEELELEFEHRCLKSDLNVDKYKVVHMRRNPADEAYESFQNEIEKLQAEIERLKRRNRKLEEDHEEMTMRLNETGNLTTNVKEINVLRSKLESSESKIQHMKELYKAASLEFREVCYMLFGYRVDRVANTNYRISSMYAESEEEYLNFRLNESGVLDMLETEYSISLGDMMRTNLVQHKSLPAFLSTLTLELFHRTTVIS